MRQPIACLIAIAAMVSIETNPAAAVTETVLYNFCSVGICSDGSGPVGGVILDSTGALYGATFGGGTTQSGIVFKLNPPGAPGGFWTEDILYNFKAKGSGENPWATLFADPTGALYGTTSAFNGSFLKGAIFKLTPPTKPGKPWTEKVILKGGPHGQGFSGSLIADASGALYGTSSSGGVKKICGKYGCGTVFKLAPPATGSKWKETPLYQFKAIDGVAPTSNLIADASGNLYGTTTAGGTCVPDDCPGGTVFELSPPAVAGGDWTETVLYSFDVSPDGGAPIAGVIADSSGNLYGTTYFGGTGPCAGGCGTVFELTRPASPGGAWTETVLYRFSGPDGANPSAGLIIDSTGTLYGTTTWGGIACADYTCGTVFKLTPPAIPGSPWTETVLYQFCSQANCTDGNSPYAGLIADSAGNLFGTTQSGGSGVGGGTVFKLSGTGFVP